MSIATRASWGARYRDGFGSRTVGRLNKYLHHSVTTHLSATATVAQEQAQMRSLEQIGQDRFAGGISYTFVIFPSGRIYQGHSVGRVGAHTAGHNTTAAGICLAGNYQSTSMTAAQLAAVAWLLVEGVRRGWWVQALLTGGHRDVKSTACPGAAAYRQIPSVNTTAVRQVSNPTPTPSPTIPTPGGSLPPPITPGGLAVWNTLLNTAHLDPTSDDVTAGRSSTRTAGTLLSTAHRWALDARDRVIALPAVLLRTIVPGTDEYVQTHLRRVTHVHHRLINVEALLTNLAGAVAALDRGQSFDQGRFLEGVRTTTEAAARKGITDGTDEVLAAVRDLLEHAEGRDAREVADLVLTELGAAITNR